MAVIGTNFLLRIEVNIKFCVFYYFLLCSGGSVDLSEMKSSEVFTTYSNNSSNDFYQRSSRLMKY